MKKRRSQFAPAASFVNETLESRIVLTAGGVGQSAAEVASVAAHRAATHTTLAVSTGTLGQPITFSATVRAAAPAGSPTGTVNIIDQGHVLVTLTLSPSTTTNGRYAYSAATITLTPAPGGAAFFFGKHSLTAQYIPSGAFAKSSAGTTFTVDPPSYVMLADGVKVATIEPGSGAQLQSGQTANLLYTGYLAKNGKIFQDSLNDGGTPFTFTLGAGQVIPGFEAGVTGMQVGETRIVEIPPAQGYGATRNEDIPANSTLVFVLTLQSIS